MSAPDLFVALAPVLAALDALGIRYYVGQVSERQWTDILGVLRSGGGTLDAGYLSEGALELQVEELLARALAEASAS